MRGAGENGPPRYSYIKVDKHQTRTYTPEYAPKTTLKQLRRLETRDYGWAGPVLNKGTLGNI